MSTSPDQLPMLNVYGVLARIETWLERISHRLNHIEDTVDRLSENQVALQSSISQLGVTVMALADDLKAGIGQLKDATDQNSAALLANQTLLATVQANITQLAGRIKNSMSDQEVADIQAALGVVGTGLGAIHTSLGAESAQLTTLGVDPTQPVPTPPPALQAARAAVQKASAVSTRKP